MDNDSDSQMSGSRSRFQGQGKQLPKMSEDPPKRKPWKDPHFLEKHISFFLISPFSFLLMIITLYFIVFTYMVYYDNYVTSRIPLGLMIATMSLLVATYFILHFGAVGKLSYLLTTGTILLLVVLACGSVFFAFELSQYQHDPDLEKFEIGRIVFNVLQGVFFYLWIFIALMAGFLAYRLWGSHTEESWLQRYLQILLPNVVPGAGTIVHRNWYIISLGFLFVYQIVSSVIFFSWTAEYNEDESEFWLVFMCFAFVMAFGSTGLAIFGIMSEDHVSLIGASLIYLTSIVFTIVGALLQNYDFDSSTQSKEEYIFVTSAIVTAVFSTVSGNSLGMYCTVILGAMLCQRPKYVSVGQASLIISSYHFS